MKQQKKIRQTQIVSAIVGSYPKPKYLFQKSGRELLDDLGFSFDTQGKRLGRQEFTKRLDKAALRAITDQNAAGIDYETDGEERRSHYVLHILKGLAGINFKKLKRINYRGGILQRDVPTVTGPIAYKKPILLQEFLFTKKHAARTPKIGLPGPSTIVDCVSDAYYNNDLKKIALDYARAIRQEVKTLIAHGCSVIQFDDPVLLRFPDRAKSWGLKALEACFHGLEDKATFIVHICCGYPNKPLEKQGVSYKANKDYYKDILSWLANSTIDVVSIEGAQSKLDVSVLGAIGKKTVMLGVLDVGVEEVESVASLVKRGKEALRYLPKEQLILAPDCGMLELSRKSAKQKLRNLAKATKILNAYEH